MIALYNQDEQVLFDFSVITYFPKRRMGRNLALITRLLRFGIRCAGYLVHVFHYSSAVLTCASYHQQEGSEAERACSGMTDRD
jgi:hypothetical protein